MAEVETFWRFKLKAFRNRILAVPSRVRDLSARLTDNKQLRSVAWLAATLKPTLTCISTRNS